MSSEYKSLDPSDHGPSPPLSSTGGGSPSDSPSPASTDRRPRGRPRKDAGAPTRVPTPQKKGRSRGQSQAEDEDSMDGTETTEAQNMQEMEVKELVLDVEEVIVPLLSSPFPSPRDGRPLSPLFQRSVSEDSAGSSASALEHAKIREKLCAFCYSGEKSFLGQGDLMVFGPTPGYVPLHIRNRRGSSEKDDDYHEDDFQDDDHDTKSPGQRDSGRGLKKISSPDSGLHSSSAPGSTDPFSEEPAPKFWDELGQIGLPDDINVQSLFDPTGQCCAHLHCAAWSEGVCRGEAQDSLLYVDKAIDSGSTECCAYCKRLGASIKCCEEGCCRSYHFPCAAAAGTFQDLRRHTLLCPDHLQLASQTSKEEVKCLLCDSAGDLQDQLFCTTCGQHYHGACLDVGVTPLKRAGWQCPECKVCLTCRNPGEDSKMLVCDMCDKGYHTFCLQPAMESIPTNGWRCKNCRVCSQCGVRQAGHWGHNITLCESCHTRPEEPAPALLCPLCGRGQGPSDVSKDDLLNCHTCKRWLRGECEKQAGGDLDLHPQADYVCTQRDMVETPASPIQEPTEPEPEPTMDVFMAVVEVVVPLEREACPSPRLEQEACPGPRLEQEACPGPRLEQEACPGPRLEQGACPLKEGEACPGPRREQGACPGPRREEGACPGPLREEGMCPRREDGACPIKEGEACPGPRREEGACPRPRREEGACPRREDGACPIKEGEACPSPRWEEGACPSPRREEGACPRREDGACPIKEGEACPSPRREEGACPSPRREEGACPSPLKEQEPKESPSGAEPAQEIQVTVTLTEGPESPQRSGTLVGVSPLACQSPAAPRAVDDQQELEISDSPEAAKRAAPEEALPHNAGETKSEDSKTTFTPPTKEISHEPLEEITEEPPVEEEKPMEVVPVEMTPSDLEQAVEEKVLEPMQEEQGAVAEKEVVQKLQKELEGEDLPPIVLDEGEVLSSNVLPVEEDTIREKELSPMAELPQRKSTVDMDTMVEMDTTPASDCSFSDFGSPRGESKAPKASPGMSPELSFRLAPSPFSTEASPRKPSPPQVQVQIQAQASPQVQPYPGYSASVLPTNTTFIPLTPKIGMGKPAISKRKFSPGRPRVKQGAWSNRRAASPPSWSQQDPSEGVWDGPQTRQLQEAPVWSMRVGRGSTFPGRRRPRGANLSGRGGRGRSRGLKAYTSFAVTPGASFVEQPYLVVEENTMHNTVVMFSTSDHFTLRQDMCVACGSFGQGSEGRLLACSQCGQCYHPFCVNIKITRVVLSKGWRCLECTVCEACGQASDPGRLLLCDDCDISYHTYCLDPPLQTVPKGSWKCKWCVSCTQCGATSPGLRCDWQNHYTLCGPCGSLASCPVCMRSYREDELIVQCRQCDRWVHACCQGLNTDEEVENAADDGFDCTMCRMHTLPSQGKMKALLSDGCEAPMVTQMVTKTREPANQKTYTQDGVCLTESGMCQLQSLVVPSSSTRRGQNRRPKPKLKLKIINQNSVAVLQSPLDPRYLELSRDGYMDNNREGDLMMYCDVKSESSPEREPVDDDAKGAEDTDGNKKRKRKPYRPGIGGFMVRQRSRTGQGIAKRSLSRKASTWSLPENPMCKEEGWNETESTPVEETPPVPECQEKVKKRYRKKKTKLEEEFPSYLQEAFFGKGLLDKSKQSRQAGLVTTGLCEELLDKCKQSSQTGLVTMGLCEESPGAHAETKPPSASFLDPLSDPLLSATSTTTPISSKAGLPNTEDPLVDLSEVLSTDADLLGMLSDDLVKSGHNSAGLDMDPIPDDPTGPCQGSACRGPRALQEEPLDVILSPELDKMVADGAILSKLYKIPELEGKDVEDLFTAVLSPSTSQPPQLPHPQPAHPGPNGPRAMAIPNPGNHGMFPRMPMMNGMMGPNPHFPPTPMMPGSTGPCGLGNFSPIHRMPFPDKIRDKKFSQMGGDVVGSWSVPSSDPGPVPGPVPPPEGETDTMSNAQRSTLKWEKEETLGEMATVAPVLYTNVNFPNLLEEFPDWAMRVKQIAKLWRKASSQDRAPYVQKARDNRAALRINKVQMSNDTLKRHQHPQQQQPLLTDTFDPNSVPLDTEMLFKDSLKPKESEHEQEWKFRQGELNQMWGPLKKQQEKVPKSKAIKSTNKDVLFGHSNQATIAAGGGKNSLQMRQKSKQQAKIEATQKLEQVKNEQLQQQQQQQQQQQLFSSQSGGDTTPNSGNQSPMTPQPSNGGKSGNSSPLQPIASKDGFARPQLPSTPTSGSQDDVFLRPQLPPPSSRTPTQETSYPQQGPSSQPQFSPGCSSGSRPSSPWDPYAKMVGTPRPPHGGGGSTTPRQNSLSEMQERGGRPSPAHESFVLPTSGNADPYAKMPDTPRPPDPFVKPMGPARVGPSGLVEQQQHQQVRHNMMSPPSGGETFARMGGHRDEVYQRMSHNRMILSDPYSRPLLTPIPGSNESGSVPVFKAPMPPQQSQQEPYGGPMPGGLKRGPSDGFPQGLQADPYAQQPLTPRPPMGEGFPNEPKMMRQTQEGHFSQPLPMIRHPHRNLYAQAPSTPRPDYSQQMSDPYAQPPGTPRPHSDSYAQPPGTPRPHSDPSYLQTPPNLRLDQFPQQHPPNHRQSPSHSMDPYASMPGTPRPAPGDRFPKSPGSQRNMDPYAQQPGTPRPLLTDPYAQAPGTSRPEAGPDVFNRLCSRPTPMSQVPADPFSHQSPGRVQDGFACPSAQGSQTAKHPGMSDESFSLPQSNHHGGQTQIHDPFELGPMTPYAQTSERQAHDIPQSSSNTVDTQNSMLPHLGDTEEKLRQRQRLRQQILRQQQQKSAIQQEKGLLQDTVAAPSPGTPRHWSHEDYAPQNDMFGRPPPPYPGPMRGGQRFPGTFLGDQRGHFPRDMGNMGMRPQEMRFGFPPSAQGSLQPGQEQHFLRPLHQMPGGPIVDNVPPQMRMSHSVDFSRGVMRGNTQMGLPQPFPPQGLPVQQHNIMGQPFIELRHRAPQNRMRMPFGHGPPNVMDPSNQPQIPPQGFMEGQEMGFAGNQGSRMMDPIMDRPSQGSVGHTHTSASMENLHQQQTEVPMTMGQRQHPSLNRSLSHPVTGEPLNAAPSSMLLPGSSTGQTEETPIPSGDGIEENMDAEDSAVKDLEDVEVKDLVDLNLNLDPDDGKDLELGPNDLHLDDFLMSGKFDLIAYTDPELNLDDKKDMFSEEDLDLGDPMEDHQHGETSDLQKALSEKRKGSMDGAATSSRSGGKSDKREAIEAKETLDMFKTEDTIKTEVKDEHVQNQDQSLCSGPMNDNRTMTNQEGAGLYEQPGQTDSSSTPVLSCLLIKEKLENTGFGPNCSPHQGDMAAQATGLHASTSMLMLPRQHAQDNNRFNPSVAMGHRVSPTLVQSRHSMGNLISGGNHSFGSSANQQVEMNLAMVVAGQQPTAHGLNPQGQQGMFPQQQGPSLGQAGPQNRPLLLEEQPLLLQDLLDQERQEQQQQRQMQAMIRQRSSDSFFPNMADFDAITDPIMKAKMVALKGINKVMSQNSMGMPPIVINRIQQTPGAHGPDAAAALPQHVLGQDGKLAPQMTRPNPPSFGPGFVNDSQRKQYEEWLQETQQLLQMQQKFLEDQIGAHRKSKKALSAKQRTAKKAGREFPEEDVEQLKHVTEQQSVVQKQLEQIRKQQKDHAELIEEYRVKQQQQRPSFQAPMMPGMPPMPGMPTQAAPMMPGAPPMGQPMMGPMMPMQPHPGQHNPARIPNMPGWHPGGAQGLMGGPGPRIPAHMPPPMPLASPAQLPPPQLPPPQLPHQAQLPPQPPPSVVPGAKATPTGNGKGAQGASGGSGGNSLAVKFDDNNPFSEGFQERERRDRLREQQERQRVQLMQEVERHRAMQQRLEMEQQGLGLGPTGIPSGPGATNPGGDSLAHMPFYSTDLPQDFMQPSRPQQQQGQLGPMYPEQSNMQPSFTSTGGPLPGQGFMPDGERRSMPGNRAFGSPEMGPNFRSKIPMLQGLNYPPGQPRPAGFRGRGMMPRVGGEGHGPPFGMDSSTPLPPNYPGSGQSLIQLYSNIIPEEKAKKKRNRKKKRDSVDDADSVKTPSTPHSDLCTPLTPSHVSDTSSTPTRSLSIPGEQDLSDLFLPVGSSGLAPSSELERQLSGSSLAQGGLSNMGSENDRASLFDETLQIKLERIETECRGAAAANEGSALLHGPRAGGVVKEEEGLSSPLHGAKGGEAGNELLKHLLKNKSTPPPCASANQTPPTQQMSCNSLSSEQEASAALKATAKPASTTNNMTPPYSQLTGSTELLEPSVPAQGKRKQQRNKRTPKNGPEKPPSRYKRRKKEEEERQIGYSSTDSLTQLKQQLSLLPLMEPLMGVNFAHFPPFGSGQLNGENRLSGSFGSASLDGVSDYYSQLIYKQNNLSNPPTPPASLPPTPPPMARQKMVNGFATAEDLARKATVLGGHDVIKGLGVKQLPTAFRTEEDLMAHAITQGPKTVDVPASLPTPPHNNQEELRGQDHCVDRDTPDSFVPSSSPESVVGMEISRYPDLSKVKEEPTSPCSSPVIPMLPSASGKGTEIKQEVKTEPSSSFFGSQFGQPPSCTKAGLVSIEITLNPVSAENIPGVVAAVAELLCVTVPGSYEVTRSPERSSLALLAGLKVPQTQGMDPLHVSMFPQQPPTMRSLRPPGSPNQPRISQQFQPIGAPTSAGSAARGEGPKPQWCCHCKVVVLGNGVRKSTKDLACSKRERPSQVFCSRNCFVLHAAATQSKATDSKPNISPLLPESSVKESPSKVLHKYSNNMSTLDVRCLAKLQPKESAPSSPPPISFPTEKPKPDTLKVTVKLKPRPRAVHSASGGGDDMSPRHHKRWKGLRWRKWSVHVVFPTRGSLLSSLPGEDEVDELLRKLGASLRPDPLPRDLRRCCFCHEEGDGMTDGPARLLNLDLDLWVHLNCALWSSEVYETQAGALINVELALRRGMAVRCTYCQQTGATSGCHRLRCGNAYHFTCALKAQCTFFKDKTMLCHLHRPRGIGSGGDRAVAPATPHHDQELRCFTVFRRVYVQRDEARQMASIVQRGERRHTFRVGSLVFHTVGQLLPQQMAAFHSANAIFPVGYRASRIYWSTRHGNHRCRYLCSVEENEGQPEFVVRVIEQGYDDLVLTGASPKGVWDKILEPVADRRNESGTLKLFPVYLKGEDLFGFTVTAVTRIVESLPGVEACDRYTFRFGRNPLMELPLAINPSGSARSEPKACSHVKRPHTLSSTGIVSSKSMQTIGSVGVVEAPEEVIPKQFASVPFQYRRMKAEWKSNVYLARSRIQGLGLYAARDIESHTMVMEYIGTLIRNEVANRMEKMYESQNRGVYMFRLDSEHVVDATITGGPARYINHSCAPNCIAEAVSLERGDKIVISSCRNIQRGEELCYDYKFDLEDDQHKIPCHCGAVNCRKWMN